MQSGIKTNSETPSQNPPYLVSITMLSTGVYRNGSERDLAVVDAEVFFAFTMALQKNLALSDDDIRSVASARLRR
jgi:hypothetical protein